MACGSSVSQSASVHMYIQVVCIVMCFQNTHISLKGGIVPSSQGIAEYPHLYNQIHDPRQHRLMGEAHVPCGVSCLCS